MNESNNKGFNLVELIVATTILTILSTIALLSYLWYSAMTRDVVRLSDISNISKAMEIMSINWNKLPIPDNKVDITASGLLVSYQWNVWKMVLSKIWIFNWWIDPLDDIYYTYSTNSTFTKYQILWFLEDIDEVNINDNYVYALVWDRYPITRWYKLWIVLNSETNQPLQKSWVGVDLINTNEKHKVYLSDTHIVTWVWWPDLSIVIPNSSCKRIAYFNKNASNRTYTINPDGTEVQKYCFMDYVFDGSLLLNITWDNWTPEDIMWNFSYSLSNFKLQSEDSVSWKGLYSQRDTSENGTLITSWSSSVWIINNSWVWKQLSEVSYCEWVKSLQSGWSAVHTLMSYYVSDDLIRFRFWNRVWSTNIKYGAYSYNPSLSLFPTIVLSQWEWNHVCDVFDGENFLKYINWELLHTSIVKLEDSFIPVDFSAANLFASSDLFDIQKISVDEMMLFNKALSSQEIKNIYNKQK